MINNVFTTNVAIICTTLLVCFNMYCGTLTNKQVSGAITSWDVFAASAMIGRIANPRVMENKESSINYAVDMANKMSVARRHP